MKTDCENELVGIVIGMMDRMGIKQISFNDAELDIIEQKCYNQSLIVEVDENGIHASLALSENRVKEDQETPVH